MCGGIWAGFGQRAACGAATYATDTDHPVGASRRQASATTAPAHSAEELASCSLPVRELVARIPAPRGDHGKDKDPALTEQLFISVRLTPADLFGDMGEVELDGPRQHVSRSTKQQSGLRAEQVARVRLASPNPADAVTSFDILSRPNRDNILTPLVEMIG